MISTKINVFRGDTIEIPILFNLNSEGTYRAQLRKTTESANYFTLNVEEDKIIITPVQSLNLIQGTYYVELEENNAGVISTVQRTTVIIRNDITRTYGEAIPDWQTNQSIEVAELITKELYIRNIDNSIHKIQSDVNYRYSQNTPSDIWIITHNLGKRPSVFITDSAGTLVEGQVKYLDSNRIEVTFSASFSGSAELN